MMSSSPSEADRKATKSLEPSARMRELISVSHEINVDKTIPVARYFHSGKELIKTASILEEKGEIEKSFVLYLRYMTLFVEKIIHHPEYAKYDRNEKTLVKNECNRVFDRAEALKKKILEKFTIEYESNKEQFKDNSTTIDGGLQKRTLNMDGCIPSSADSDIDDIDRKFNFSHIPEPHQRDDTFDPFNIEELKKSFQEERK